MRKSPQRRRTDGTTAEEGAAPEDHGLKWLAKLKSKTMTGRSIREQAERPPSPPKCQERWYSAYANLRWEKLGGYLKELFPDYDFPHDKRNDKYFFNIPRDLKPEETQHIEQLRDSEADSNRRPAKPEE